MQFSYIPLTPGEFYSHVHWQNGLLSGLTNKNNKCLINLLAKSDTMQIAESCKNREPSRVSFSQNVFYMSHTFGKVVGNLLVSNSKVIIEALCRKGTLLKKSDGLLVIGISLDCDVLINGQIMLTSDQNSLGFQPTVILERKNTIPLPSTESWWQYVDYIQFSLILLCISLLCLCI